MWHNLSFISQALESLMGPAGVQVARQSLLKPANITTVGRQTSRQPRLFVRLLSFALIESISVALALVTLGVIIFYAPCAVCSTDPSSIGGLAVILSRSSALMQRLKGFGTLESSLLAENMIGLSCRTVPDESSSLDSFQIVHSDPHLSSEESDTSVPRGPYSFEPKEEQVPIKWWQPFSVTLPARVLLIGTTLGLIVALELLYNHSRSHSPVGLAQVSPANTYIRYTWVYIPALAMVCVQLLFASLYFSTKVFQPYHALRLGGSTARQSLIDRQVGTVPLQSLWRAVVNWQPAGIAISLAMMLAPFLTIVVSGLYTTVAVDAPSRFPCHRSMSGT